MERGAAAVRADELSDVELPHPQRGRSARRVRRFRDLPGPVGTVARPLDREGQESLRTRRGARLDRESQVVVEVSSARRETWPRAPRPLRPTANAVTHNRISTSSARSGTPPARTGAAGTRRAIWPTTSSRRNYLGQTRYVWRVTKVGFEAVGTDDQFIKAHAGARYTVNARATEILDGKMRDGVLATLREKVRGPGIAAGGPAGGARGPRRHVHRTGDRQRGVRQAQERAAHQREPVCASRTVR